ncbi:MAG: RNA polymerase sigma factor [Bacteroidia bacterium]
MSKSLDEEIFKQCLQNNRKAQEEFYNHFCRIMYAVCLRYSNNTEDANDILQEGFIKVFGKLHQYSGKGSLEGWIKRIFINTALEHYRVHKVYHNQSDIDYANENPQNDFLLEKISVKEILQVLNKMATGYRTVINLYAIEGYSHAEIAEMLGISEGTSKSQLARARQVLANELKKLKGFEKKVERQQ